MSPNEPRPSSCDWLRLPVLDSQARWREAHPRNAHTHGPRPGLARPTTLRGPSTACCRASLPPARCLRACRGVRTFQNIPVSDTAPRPASRSPSGRTILLTGTKHAGLAEAARWLSRLGYKVQVQGTRPGTHNGKLGAGGAATVLSDLLAIAKRRRRFTGIGRHMGPGGSPRRPSLGRGLGGGGQGPGDGRGCRASSRRVELHLTPTPR